MFLPEPIRAERVRDLPSRTSCSAKRDCGRRCARALGQCREGMTLYESLRSADTSNAQSAHDLAVGHISMHKVLGALGDPIAALAQLDSCTALLRDLLSANADNVLALRDLARSRLYSATLHARLAAGGRLTEPERASHRASAESAFEEGSRLLLGASGRGLLSAEDSTLVSGARLSLEHSRSRH